VHYIAAIRLLLGPSNKIERLSAFTTQLQPHLPPIDTLTAVLQTTSGVPGTVSTSFGTTFAGEEYSVACEEGTVTVTRGTVVVTRDGKEETKTFPEETNGVKEEVVVWADGLKHSNIDKRQTPEEALADLHLVSVVNCHVQPVLTANPVGVNF
jgi:predicted dehydrogenase